MSKLKRSSYIWLAIGLGTLIILGGIFLAYTKGLIPNVPKPPIQDPNPITFEEVDVFLFTTHIPEDHEMLWNDLQQYEQRRDPRISMINLLDIRSEQTRELNTKSYSPFFHVANYSESKVPIKATLYRNNEVKYESILKPGEMFVGNRQLGKGKYRLKIECIGEGHCKAKGAITTGIVEW
jgi:hypothetical protein